MVKEVVVTKHLSGEMIDAGRDLIVSLDNDNAAIGGALWLYASETETWKFVIAVPEVKSKGPKKAYEKVQSTILRMPKEKPSISLRDISIRDTNDPLITLLRIMLRTGSGVSGIRATGNVISGVLIEDAYIYRLV